MQPHLIQYEPEYVQQPMYLERYEVLPEDTALVARRSWLRNPDAAPILSPQVVQRVIVKREPVVPDKTAK